MSENNNNLLEQVMNSRKKKRLEALKNKLGGMLDDRDKAAKALADIDANIIAALEEEGAGDAETVAQMLG